MTHESPKSAQHKREPITTEQAEAARGRILGLRDVLAGHFIAKDRILDLMMIAAVSREPLLLVGPPGTAKSDLVVKFCQALGVTGDDYFEYMLTRFTEPSEILGPVDINALRDGRYLRRDEGRLTRAKVAFLDEIFKANSAILNLLLTIINERKSYQDGKPVDVPLEVLFGATNEIPEQGELLALSDRFSLKVLCQSVQADHFTQLIDLGLKAEGYRLRGVAPWADQRCSLEDFAIANQFLAQQFSSERTKGTGAHQTVLNDRETFFPAELFGEFKRIIRAMPVDFRVTVSDRKVIRLYRLIRTRAWLFHGGLVRAEDLGILEHAGDTLPQMETLAKKIPLLLGGD